MKSEPSENNQTTRKDDGHLPRRRNIWNLILGLIFLGYGIFRVYTLRNTIGDNTLGFILALAFIAFGLYDLWKYQNRL